MMLFLDANVIVYSIANIDEDKLQLSQQLINKAIEENSIVISPLVLQELIFTLGKLKVKANSIIENFNIWKHFSISSIDEYILEDAVDLCKKNSNFKIINDAIHLKFAERYCSKLVTFDKHFKQFIPYTHLQIDILPPTSVSGE